jgi:proteic killer suppression protein
LGKGCATAFIIKNQRVILSIFAGINRGCSHLKRSAKKVRQLWKQRREKDKPEKIYCKITLDVNNEIRYHSVMIKTFKSKETEKIFQRSFSRKLPHDPQKIALRKLWILDAATDLNALRIPPANHLEALHGDREGQHSIRINKQWRICFEWRENNAYHVEIVDYH